MALAVAVPSVVFPEQRSPIRRSSGACATASADADGAAHATLAVQDRTTLARLHTGSETHLADLLRAADLVRVMHGLFLAGRAG